MWVERKGRARDIDNISITQHQENAGFLHQKVFEMGDDSHVDSVTSYPL